VHKLSILLCFSTRTPMSVNYHKIVKYARFVFLDCVNRCMCSIRVFQLFATAILTGCGVLFCVILFYELFVQHIYVCTRLQNLTDSDYISNAIEFVATRHRANASCDECTDITLTQWQPASTALIIVDVWDSFFYKETNARIAQMATALNNTVHSLRTRGVTIIHAPFNQDRFYKHTAIKKRTDDLIRTARKPLFVTWKQYHPLEEVVPYSFPPNITENGPSRQSKLLHIDHARDFLITEPKTAFWTTKAILDYLSIDRLLYAGILDNKCLLDRHNGMLEMAAAGYEVALLQNFSITGFSPHGAWKNVSYDNAHKRQQEYIRKCVAPTVHLMD